MNHESKRKIRFIAAILVILLSIPIAAQTSAADSASDYFNSGNAKGIPKANYEDELTLPV